MTPRSASIAILLIAATTMAGEPVTRARFQMGTVCVITVPAGHDAASRIDAAFGEADRVERLLSTWRRDSELAKLNSSPQNEDVVVNHELYQLLATTMNWSEKTKGAFNPLVAPLIEAWGIRASGRVPDAAEIAALLRSLTTTNVRFAEGNRIVRTHEARFEEGGFGKGYAIDRMITLLKREGAPTGVVDFGGQIATFGSEPLTVAIAHPAHRKLPAISVVIRQGSLSTSSGSEKFFEGPSGRFSHIVDPRSGVALPPTGSASVFCEDTLTADILSTALYVMGPETGLQWANEHEVAAVFLESQPGETFHVRSSHAWRTRLGRTTILDSHFTTKD